jgi:lysine-specific demethylase 8
VVLAGVIEHWPARTRWDDPSYFCSVAGYRTVPVEVGQHYLAEGWGTRLMTVAEFVRQHLLQQQQGGGPPEGASGGAAAAGAEGKQQGRAASAEVQQQAAWQLQQQVRSPGQPAVAAQEQQAPCSQLAAQAGAGTTRASGSSSSGGADTGRSPSGTQAGQQQQQQQRPVQRGYLAQHALFDQLPALAADIATPDYCTLGAGELVATNAWIGPAGTVTPLHTDPHHNLLAQVAGSKYVRLYSPQCGAALYAHAEGLVTNSSRVDLDDVDEGQFPLFGGAPWLECVLGPGDVLYIPPGWWHYVKALSVSCSVSFWWR